MFIKVGQYYYSNPLFYGEDWCIRVHDDEPLALILKSRAQTQKAARSRGLAVLKANGITASVTDAYKRTGTFPPAYDGVHDAWVLVLKLKAELPISVLSQAVTTGGRTSILPEGAPNVEASSPRSSQAAHRPRRSRPREAGRAGVVARREKD